MMFLTNERNKDVMWHVGQPKPAIDGVLVSMQIDGDELEFVRCMFPNITPNKVRVAIIAQPFAQLVYDNLDG